jgi:xylulose-5-phosphate/fructose-6-phosphate phosphoketolase
LTYRRTNHANFHVRGYCEEGTITTAFDMTVLNQLDRFHLVLSALERLPGASADVARLQEHCRERLREHSRYIRQWGQDMPEIRDWRWGA